MDDIWTMLEILCIITAGVFVMGFAVVGVSCIWHDHAGMIEEAASYLVEMNKHKGDSNE